MSIEIKQQGNDWNITLVNEKWLAKNKKQALAVVDKLMSLKDEVGDIKNEKMKKMTT